MLGGLRAVNSNLCVIGRQYYTLRHGGQQQMERKKLVLHDSSNDACNENVANPEPGENPGNA